MVLTKKKKKASFQTSCRLEQQKRSDMNFLTSLVSFPVLIKKNRTSANGEDMILKMSPESINSAKNNPYT